MPLGRLVRQVADKAQVGGRVGMQWAQASRHAAQRSSSCSLGPRGVVCLAPLLSGTPGRPLPACLQVGTHRSWKRPYGVGLIVAGHDESGACLRVCVASIGGERCLAVLASLPLLLPPLLLPLLPLLLRVLQCISPTLDTQHPPPPILSLLPQGPTSSTAAPRATITTTRHSPWGRAPRCVLSWR